MYYGRKEQNGMTLQVLTKYKSSLLSSIWEQKEEMPYWVAHSPLKMNVHGFIQSGSIQSIQMQKWVPEITPPVSSPPKNSGGGGGEATRHDTQHIIILCN